MSTPRFVQAYTLDALTNLPPKPILAKRVPTVNDVGYPLGSLWIDVPINAAYILTSVVSASANWQLIEVSGGGSIFSSLTVTPGPISLTGTTSINTTGAAVTSIGNTGGASGIAEAVGTGNYVLSGAAGSTITIGTGVTTGAITIGGAQTTGDLTIGGAAATGTLSLGFSTAANTILIGNGIGASSIDIVAGTGGLELQAPRLLMGAAGALISFYTGAGAPANGLALEAGDIYINTSPTGATDRMFIATGVGAWTNITCAA